MFINSAWVTPPSLVNARVRWMFFTPKEVHFTRRWMASGFAPVDVVGTEANLCGTNKDAGHEHYVFLRVLIWT